MHRYNSWCAPEDDDDDGLGYLGIYQAATTSGLYATIPLHGFNSSFWFTC